MLHPTVNTFAPEYATTTLDRRGNEREKTSTYVQRMKKPKNNATVRPPAHLCTAPDLLPTLILALIAPSQMRSKCAKAVCLCCLEHKLKDQLDHIERQKQDPLLLKTRTWELAVKDAIEKYCVIGADDVSARKKHLEKGRTGGTVHPPSALLEEIRVRCMAPCSCSVLVPAAPCSPKLKLLP